MFTRPSVNVPFRFDGDAIIPVAEMAILDQNIRAGVRVATVIRTISGLTPWMVTMQYRGVITHIGESMICTP